MFGSNGVVILNVPLNSFIGGKDKCVLKEAADATPVIVTYLYPLCAEGFLCWAVFTAAFFLWG